MTKTFGWAVLLLGAGACGPASVQGIPLNQVDQAAASGFNLTVQRGVGSSAVADVELTESAPTTAAGAATGVRVDRDSPTGTGKSTTALLRFDLGAIPKGSTVSSAALTLNVFNSTSGGGFAVYQSKRAWTEGTATWQLASAGAAWAAPGARGGADRGTTVLGTLLPTVLGKHTLQLNAEGLKVVQAWVNDPASNLGLAVDSPDNTDGLQFDSSEAATVANRPALTVGYAPPNLVPGLLGTYYSGTAFQTQVLQRTDATVGFDWANGSPATGVPADGFSVRWTGKIIPRYSETYTFSTVSDDGIRLLIGGQQVISNWTNHASTENTGTISLTAGQPYDLTLEFYENSGQATSKLSWSSKSQAKEIVPQAQLLSAAPTGTPPPPPPPPPTTDGTFSIIVMPDVQREMWTPAGQDNWHNRIQWIIDHKTSDDIRVVLQVGDLTDTDSCGGADVLGGVCSPALRDFGTYYPIPGQPTHYQFYNADSGLKMLEQAQIPFILTPGNHDTAIVCGGPTCYGHPEWDVPTQAQRGLLRLTTAWNTWFPPSRFKLGAGTFEAGKSDNMFHTFSAGGVSWLVLNFELYARVEAIDWAKSVIAAHPNHNVIILTHSYLSSDGSVGTSPEYGSTAPTYLRDNLVKAFPNVKFTFSGHVGLAAHHTETGVGGNVVHSFLDCYHDTTNNLMRMVTFDVPNNKITTYVYAPKTNYYAVTSQTYSVQFVH